MDEIKTKSRLFWLLQISGWTMLHFIYLILYYRQYIDDIPRMASLFITHATGFAATLLLRYIYRRIRYRDKSIGTILVTVIGATVVFANIWLWFDLGITVLTDSYTSLTQNFPIERYFGLIWSNSFTIFMWSILYFGVNLWFDYKRQKDRTEQANELAHSAQLQMLRYQLNPHFLFNSLYSIRALVEEDRSRAKSMINELSEFLRYSLISKDYKNVPFGDELEAMQHYLAIEKTRYEEKLHVEYDIDPAAESYPVLSFLIHPIIENALKYGMQTSTLPLELTIGAKVKDDLFHITICNSGKWIEPGKNSGRQGTGTGLENVKNRLQNAFPDHHSFSINTYDDRVCVSIEIRSTQ